MRILIATSNGLTLGGIEAYFNSIVPQLLDRGHDVGLMWELPPSALPARPWTSHPRLTACLKPIAMPLVDDWRPDVVYSQGLVDVDLESTLARRFPTIVYAHVYQGTCISGTKCFSHVNYEICRRTLGPMCLAYYLPFGCGGKNPLTMWKLYRAQRQRLSMLSDCRAILIASRHMQDEYRRHGVDEARLKYLKLFPTDIAPDPTPPHPRLRTDRLLYVGRVVPLKGTLHLAEAVASASSRLGRRLTLVVAGVGSDTAELRRSAEDHQVPLEMLGAVEPQRRTEEMRRADLLLVPSRWPEPFGLVGIEAGCVGLPTAGYINGGIADWLLPGTTGESPQDGDNTPQGLASAILKALQDDTHWNSLRLGAWKCARTYDVEDHVSGLVKIFEAAVHI